MMHDNISCRLSRVKRYIHIWYMPSPWGGESMRKEQGSTTMQILRRSENKRIKAVRIKEYKQWKNLIYCSWTVYDSHYSNWSVVMQSTEMLQNRELSFVCLHRNTTMAIAVANHKIKYSMQRVKGEICYVDILTSGYPSMYPWTAGGAVLAPLSETCVHMLLWWYIQSLRHGEHVVMNILGINIKSCSAVSSQQSWHLLLLWCLCYLGILRDP